MIRFVPLELLRLRRTLVGPLMLAAPLLATVMAALIATRQAPSAWGDFFQSLAALWAWFVLPTSVAALSALLAQVEHGPRLWDHLLALPISRGRLFLSKAVLLLVLGSAMTLLLVPLALGAGLALQTFLPTHAPVGPVPLQGMVALAGLMAAASATMCIVQIWVALRFASFIPPLVLGLAATFAVVAGMGAPELNWLPWAAPLNVMGLGQASPPMALLIGSGAAPPLLALMIFHLTRREI